MDIIPGEPFKGCEHTNLEGLLCIVGSVWRIDRRGAGEAVRGQLGDCGCSVVGGRYQGVTEEVEEAGAFEMGLEGGISRIGHEWSWGRGQENQR